MTKPIPRATTAKSPSGTAWDTTPSSSSNSSNNSNNTSKTWLLSRLPSLNTLLLLRSRPLRLSHLPASLQAHTNRRLSLTSNNNSSTLRRLTTITSRHINSSFLLTHTNNNNTLPRIRHLTPPTHHTSLQCHPRLRDSITEVPLIQPSQAPTRQALRERLHQTHSWLGPTTETLGTWANFKEQLPLAPLCRRLRLHNRGNRVLPCRGIRFGAVRLSCPT